MSNHPPPTPDTHTHTHTLGIYALFILTSYLLHLTFILLQHSVVCIQTAVYGLRYGNLNSETEMNNPKLLRKHFESSIFSIFSPVNCIEPEQQSKISGRQQSVVDVQNLLHVDENIGMFSILAARVLHLFLHQCFFDLALLNWCPSIQTATVHDVGWKHEMNKKTANSFSSLSNRKELDQ